MLTNIVVFCFLLVSNCLRALQHNTMSVSGSTSSIEEGSSRFEQTLPFSFIYARYESMSRYAVRWFFFFLFGRDLISLIFGGTLF
jgi:hypothetical protein